MQEKVIVKPLSGTEVKKAILARIEKQMNQDCTLRDIEAYPAFSFNFNLTIHYETLGQTNGTVIAGQEKYGEPENPETGVVMVEEPTKAPNQVRKESGQGIPVMTKDETGRPVEKRVTYRDPEFAGKKAK